MDKKTKSVCHQETYKFLYSTYYDALRNFLYYKCGDIKQAEDLAQDAFIKLWNNCSKVVYEKAKSYLFTIARNEFLNFVAHKKIVLNYRLQPTNNTSNETPEFLLEEKEFLVKLKNTIAELPEKQREVFLLSRIDKKKYAEIAEILDISVKAVEKRMSLALITLREKIGNI